jgi:hypothetical protein
MLFAAGPQIKELEAQVAALKKQLQTANKELALWRSEHDPCPFALENERLTEQVRVLKETLGNFYDKWENGIPCSEADEEGNCEDGGSIGNACRLTFEEEQQILNLIVDGPAEGEQACANCGKPYRAHLLHDGNKCSTGSATGWFPKPLADAIIAARSAAPGKVREDGN